MGQEQDLLPVIAKHGLVMNHFFLAHVEFRLNSAEVVLVEPQSLLLADVLKLDPVVLVVGLVAHVFNQVAFLDELAQAVLVFVDGVQGAWRCRHLLFLRDFLL